MDREQGLAAAFAGLADTLVSDFDEKTYAEAMARRCIRVLDADAVALVLSGNADTPPILATAAESVRDLDSIRAVIDEGPSADCMSECRLIGSADLRSETRWPAFTLAALNAGFATAHALPLLLRAERIGTLTLFRRRAGALGDHNAAVATALAETATAALLSRRTIYAARTRAGQLQAALRTRTTIEQAKGYLAARRGDSVDAAFELIRSTARQHRRRLSDVARDVMDGSPVIAHLFVDHSADEANGAHQQAATSPRLPVVE
ncbi:MAG: ANTAR domain-containing protein [Pseudonocardiaceae bacterium]|nr:ANTAR domain-containing protein [Pseudonocardiaceae bacterium]